MGRGSVQEGQSIAGVINIYKEKGYTSHDVVAIIRRMLREKFGKIKVGHTGTLDPQAEGVLPICVGKATKMAAFITAENKSYKAELLLGLTTDTGDHTGAILTGKLPDASDPGFPEDLVQAAIKSFIGGYQQIPPMYSAIKIGGKKLYELARQGKQIERQPRFVEITRIDILEINNNRIWLDIDCGKGTYIRSLCEDIGAKLKTGGCMGDLIRTKSGQYTINTAKKLSEIEQMIKKDSWDFVI